LRKAHIIVDIVQDFQPKCFVAPVYNSTKKAYPVTLGNTLKPSQTEDIPTMKINCPSINQTTGLTIILTDPDAPSRDNPKWSEFCHWIVIVSAKTGDEPLDIEIIEEVVECNNVSRISLAGGKTLTTGR
jgi:hypothetical protein